jgi:hypothetical protein
METSSRFWATSSPWSSSLPGAPRQFEGVMVVVVVVVVEDRVAASGVMKLLLVQDALMVDKRDNISVSGDASLRL